MTVENAKNFFQRMQDDSSFSKTFMEMSGEERQEYRLGSGYDFTPEEWQQAVDEIQAVENNEELSEKELETIAGGIDYRSFGGIGIYGSIYPDFFR